jgi:hypothetical protein
MSTPDFLTLLAREGAHFAAVDTPRQAAYHAADTRLSGRRCLCGGRDREALDGPMLAGTTLGREPCTWWVWTIW